ncbi:MAG: BrnT family toxin [bacterium]|nr:BrnT family toxin [bacterium]
MKFTWDETKRKANLVKHGMDFAGAKTVFAGATFTFEDDRFAYGEQRFITLGMLKEVVVVIAHTEQDDVVRVISMRKATKHEQNIYFQGFTN